MKIPTNNLYMRLFEQYIDRNEGFTYKDVMGVPFGLPYNPSDKNNIISTQAEFHSLHLLFIFADAIARKNKNIHSIVDSSFMENNPIMAFHVEDPANGPRLPVEKSLFTISYGGRMAYLDYLELKHSLEFAKEAQVQSQTALHWAKIALWITAFFGVLQIITGWCQIRNDNKLAATSSPMPSTYTYYECPACQQSETWPWVECKTKE